MRIAEKIISNTTLFRYNKTIKNVKLLPVASFACGSSRVYFLNHLYKLNLVLKIYIYHIYNIETDFGKVSNISTEMMTFPKPNP